MAIVRAPYPEVLNDIHGQSIISFERSPDPSIATFRDRAGEVEGTFRIRNPEDAFSRAIRRIGAWDSGYRDVLIKGWIHPQQPNVKLANPSTLPQVGSRRLVWSQDSKYLAVSSGNDPFLIIYVRIGDAFTPATIAPTNVPTDICWALEWSPDGRYLLIGDGYEWWRLFGRTANTNNFAHVRSGTNLLPDFPLGGNAITAKWARNGLYLFIASSASPYHAIYKRDSQTDTTFTKLSDLPDLPGLGGPIFGIVDGAWSNDGQHLAIGGNATPNLYIYKRSGNTFTMLSGVTSPITSVRGLSYTLDDKYLAVALDVAPYLIVYRREGDNYAKLSDPAEGGVGAVDRGGVDWTPDGKYVAIASKNTTPYHSVWKFENDLLIKESNLGTAPTGNALDLKFSPDGKYVAIATSTSPFLQIYKSANSPISGAAMRIDPNTPYLG